jgi:hypothetical protein
VSAAECAGPQQLNQPHGLSFHSANRQPAGFKYFIVHRIDFPFWNLAKFSQKDGSFRAKSYNACENVTIFAKKIQFQFPFKFSILSTIT